jgi:hypothetical protein
MKKASSFNCPRMYHCASQVIISTIKSKLWDERQYVLDYFDFILIMNQRCYNTICKSYNKFMQLLVFLKNYMCKYGYNTKYMCVIVSIKLSKTENEMRMWARLD